MDYRTQTNRRDDKGIKFAQLNLGKGRGATSNILEISERERLDVLFLQEPNTLGDKVVGFSRNFKVASKTVERPRSCIVIANSNYASALLDDLSCELLTVAEINTGLGNFHAVSGYFPPITRPRYEEDELFARLCRALEELTRLGTRIVIGGDFNAKSTVWGGAVEDARGERLAEVFNRFNLTVINDGSGPTFVGHGGGSSFIDITVASLGMYADVREWRLRDEETLSDHRLITWEVEAPAIVNQNTTETRFCNKRADWGEFARKFGEIARDLTGQGGSAEDRAAALNDAIVEACRASMPLRRRFERSVPWWTPELTRRRAVARRARRRWQRAGDELRRERELEYRRLAREYKTAIEDTRTRKWQEFCTRSSEKDPWGTAYRVVRGKRRDADVLSTVRKEDGSCTRGVRETTDYLLEIFFPGDDGGEETGMQRAIRRAAGNARGGDANDRAIGRGEIRAAAARMNPNKAPGHDGVTADAVLRALDSCPEIFSEVFNGCLTEGVFPRCWKVQTVRFIPKPGRSDRSEPRGFRPISLLPVLGKVLDRIMAVRVEHLVNEQGGFHARQFGFRAGRTTVDAIEFVLAEVRGARERGQYCAVIALDIAGAFDNAWWPRIIWELERRDCPRNLIRLVKSYFSDRRARVELPDGEVSRDVERGCPQGSCSGPTFWNLLYESIFRVRLPEGCDIVAFADDTVLIVRAAQFKTLKARANEALGMLGEWAAESRLSFNARKTEALFFGKRPGQERPSFVLNGERIRCKEAIRYLGVLIDDRLSWDQHVKYVSGKGKELAHKIGAAARLTWGFRGPALGRVYEGAIQPAMAYAAAVWAGGSKVRHSRQLLSAQRVVAVKAASAYCTVSTEAALVLSKLLPIDLFLQEEAAKRRLLMDRDRRLNEELGLENRAIERRGTYAELGHPENMGKFRFHLEEDRDARIRCYTDGSRLEDGRAGAAFVVYSGTEEVGSGKFKLGGWSSIFQCELLAIREALEYLEDNEYAFVECSLHTDSRSALLALQGMHKPTELQIDVWRRIRRLSDRIRLSFHWVKSHAGTEGNERADQLAKEAAEADVGAAYDAVPRALLKRRLREHTLGQWEARWREAETGRRTAQFFPTVTSRISLGMSLDRHIVQLITGHGNFRAYLVRIGKLPDGGEDCDCGDVPDDAEHVLLHCTLEEPHRARSDRRLVEAGYRWPRSMEEVTTLAGVREWWDELNEFAGRVERLKFVRAVERRGARGAGV